MILGTEMFWVNAYYSAILAFLLVLAAAGNTFARVVELPLEPIKSQFHEPHEVVEIYLQAVGRGELVVFDRKLDRSMLTPVRVIYIYDLDSAIPRIKVYSKLKESMPVPGQKNIKFRGVSVILDADGRIIETEAHIWPE